MWKTYFKVIKIVPGPVRTQAHGTIDLSRDNIPLETLLELYEHDFPYLKLTAEGEKRFYGVDSNDKVNPPVNANESVTNVGDTSVNSGASDTVIKTAETINSPITATNNTNQPIEGPTRKKKARSKTQSQSKKS